MVVSYHAARRPASANQRGAYPPNGGYAAGQTALCGARADAYNGGMVDHVVRASRGMDETLERMGERLRCDGFRLTHTFGLRAALPAGAAYDCPDHPGRACECDYRVLLLYSAPAASNEPPAVIEARHAAGVTWLTLRLPCGLAMPPERYARITGDMDAAATTP